ncbi:hypothetical protein NLG97_g2019 [Lecanicillium saksenae]|uniref:Uncharacterized protein n=1 Tax=Lecanicillium saksenae TaxID=468837 RepID=A0ACC1R3Z6_9HYPO|nr:hypothetical protein NLG97_g2019 [Lecanicillium saksenae]
METDHPGCTAGADNRFGPRVDPSCRSFDFTLLFEDAIFTALPAAVFLLFVPVQIWRIAKTNIKTNSYTLATWKLCFLAILFSCHIAFLVLLSQTPGFATSLSLASGVLSTVAVAAAGALSFLKDQRSARPSDILVLYFSICTMLAIPRFRTIWLIPHNSALKAVLTFDLVATIAVAVAESVRKIRFLRQPYKKLPTEETAGEAEDRTLFGRALVGAFALTYIGMAVSRALYHRQTYRMTARVRAGLISKIYQDTTVLRHADIKDLAAVTLMGTDVERIYESFGQIHEIWASPIEIVVAVWLLVRQVSYAALLPLAICLLSIVGASQIGNHFGPAMIAWIKRVQTRVAVTASFLNDIKAVKMLGLSDALYEITKKLRRDELRASGKFRRLLVLQILTGNIPTLLAPFTTFVVYAIIAKVKKDESLLAAQAFTALSLISLVTEPLITLCEAWPRVTQGVACFQRIEEYCAKAKEGAPASGASRTQEFSDGVEMCNKDTLTNSAGALVSFRDAQISWSATEEKNILHDLNLDINPGFTAVIGAVAAGKSTLLSSIIGETTIKNGSMSHVSSEIALCSQTPFVVDDTVRRNIVGDQEFVQEWYDFAITACCLKKDLARLPMGDQFRCGTKGSALSGGQRHRVALARAVFSKLRIVILDDVMSGFDPQTTGNILTNLFSKTGYFRKAGISVILATHNQRILPYMDSVVVMENGRVTDADSFEQVKLRSPELLKATTTDEAPEHTEEDEPNATARAASIDEDPETALEQDSLRRRTGSWSVYSYYGRSAGATSLTLWIIFTFIGAVAGSYTSIWIQRWTEANEKHPNENTGLYLGVYALLVIVSIAGTAGECWVFFVNIINDTAIKLHDDLLTATLRAPFHFFHSTDTGSVTNRFSQDMDLIDMTLPTNAITFTTAAAACIVQLVIICVVGKYLAVTIPALVFILFAIQRYYLRTSRQLRLMDIEAKAPIYKLFIETIEGVATIRALGWGSAFHDRLYAVLNTSQKPLYMLAAIQQWLALVLELIVGGMAVVIVASATATTNTITAGDLGVALVLVLQFSSLLTQCIQSWTRLETSIGAVARVQEFINSTPSEQPGSTTLPKDFPERGAIHCEKLTASYSSDSGPVLKQVELSFAPGEKVALCGPSGSGKSSLIMSILSMMGSTEGRVTIDDIDTSTVAGNSLRMHLNVIPQEPFFLPGTVRMNIDPRGTSLNEAIISALDRVGMWDKIKGKGGLDADLDSSEFSSGERQMLCLARAMLVPGKILILDEAMSSVDKKTEADMQAVIDSEFKDQTVISVLHRFDHIQSYGKVVVLRDGEMVESGTPNDLLASDSAFRALYKAQH